MKTKIIVIVGPTAVGKTALSIEVAKHFNGQIISGDSQQVYRGLDIGTAKIRTEEQEGIPHHLLDVREVGESYSAYDFVTEAAQAIREIEAQGQLPIICGGTGLYIQSLLEGYHLGGSVPHEEILTYRAQLDSWSDEALFGKIAELGIEIPQMNRRRAMRALEIAHLGGQLENNQPDYEALLICLDDERERLYERINQRVVAMLDAGMVDEALKVYPKRELNALNTVGYKELFEYLDGLTTIDEAIFKIQSNTRRYARKQLTWYKKDVDIKWFHPDNIEEILKYTRTLLQNPSK